MEEIKIELRNRPWNENNKQKESNSPLIKILIFLPVVWNNAKMHLSGAETHYHQTRTLWKKSKPYYLGHFISVAGGRKQLH